MLAIEAPPIRREGRHRGLLSESGGVRQAGRHASGRKLARAGPAAAAAALQEPWHDKAIPSSDRQHTLSDPGHRHTPPGGLTWKRRWPVRYSGLLWYQGTCGTAQHPHKHALTNTLTTMPSRACRRKGLSRKRAPLSRNNKHLSAAACSPAPRVSARLRAGQLHELWGVPGKLHELWGVPCCTNYRYTNWAPHCPSRLRARGLDCGHKDLVTLGAARVLVVPSVAVLPAWSDGAGATAAAASPGQPGACSQTPRQSQRAACLQAVPPARTCTQGSTQAS